ncbi:MULTISPECIES: o-succinylbenzoate synthase [unclassified Corynebacterium]|uniref:o-succinylbenzoate synthase n=1 Tax=unclassified Corynebacterium TaxID=2624378 RepID=UPI0021691623|nr:MULTISPECIES: o-succinylbenzoate synthase [unclassified Corynebacterium]MCS4491291.1 o-succinylbenzoate synthase [Corynebacterium sp. ES2715-CONJ3]MCS4531612.1 o-succinylbenzoate synthase [Corynebacterium sp. ES2730-CONJ]
MTVSSPSDISVDELIERAHIVSLPMRVPFRGLNHREAVLIEGPEGWGEFSPFIEYEPHEAVQWLRCGMEMAFQGPPPINRELIAVNATIPAVAAAEVEGVLAQFPGCTTIKVKVAEAGTSLDQDCERIQRVRELVPHAKIRVDANRGWSVAQALEAAHRLGPLDYMEQPCHSAAELKELRELLLRSGLIVRVAADESIRRVEDPYDVAETRAADVAVVKAAPLGGPRAVLKIAEFYRARGLDITVASALDTGVGMNAGIAAVAGLPVFYDDDGFEVPPAAAGLATQRLFVADITAERPLIDGHMSTELLEPDMDRVAEFKASADRRDFWITRLTECFELL